MGSVQKRPNGTWRARVRVDGREVAKHFPKKSDAEKWASIQEAKLATGEWVDPRRGNVTMKEYAEAWRAIQPHRGTTRLMVESHLRLHVYPVLGRRPLGQLRTTEMMAWQRGIGENLAPATVATVVRIVRTMLRAAVRDRLIASSPMDGIRLPRLDLPMVRPLSVDEVGKLLEAVPMKWRAAVALGAGCGLRSGEVLGLAPESVDFLRRRVRVERQLIALPPSLGGLQVGPPKTRTSRREVMLPSVVATELAVHMERWPPITVELGSFIFSNRYRSPMARGRFSEMVATAAKSAGLPDGVRFHALRHHYASLLIGSGLSVKAVQSALGHANAAETLDTYGHLWPSEEEAMGRAVDDAWTAKAPPGQAAEGL
jgi:integrase